MSSLFDDYLQGSLLRRNLFILEVLTAPLVEVQKHVYHLESDNVNSDSGKGPCRKSRDVVLALVYMYRCRFALHVPEVLLGEIDISGLSLPYNSMGKYCLCRTCLPLFAYLIAHRDRECSLINLTGA